MFEHFVIDTIVREIHRFYAQLYTSGKGKEANVENNDVFDEYIKELSIPKLSSSKRDEIGVRSHSRALAATKATETSLEKKHLGNVTIL